MKDEKHGWFADLKEYTMNDENEVEDKWWFTRALINIILMGFIAYAGFMMLFVYMITIGDN